MKNTAHNWSCERCKSNVLRHLIYPIKQKNIYKGMNTASNIQAKRMELKEISNTLKELKQNGGITTINEGLLSIYNLQGHKELKTFEQWERQGKRIKKGVKALYLWGRQTTKTVNEEGHEKEIQYFPLVALFSDIQVYEPQF